MTTLTELADRAQNAISDAAAATWSQTVVEEWTVEGIRDYNRHFPRTIATTIAAADDDHQYDLPEDFRGIVSVEYPTGEDPPKFLKQKSRLGNGFWGQSGFFDVIPRNDAANVAELVISEAGTTGNTIGVEYLGDHDLSLVSANDITVPLAHEGAIIEFVIWRAWLELLGAEQQSPTSSSSLLMAQYASNADRAKRSYVESIARLLRSVEGKHARVKWQMDKYDRIY